MDVFRSAPRPRLPQIELVPCVTQLQVQGGKNNSHTSSSPLILKDFSNSLRVKMRFAFTTNFIVEFDKLSGLFSILNQGLFKKNECGAKSKILQNFPYI